jgi:hypothetical protein
MLLKRDRPRAQGYAYLTEIATGRIVAQTDTYTCAHECGGIIHAPVNRKFEEVADFCRCCMQVICARCADKRVCSPLMKKIEAMEEAYHARRSYGV